MPKFTEKTMKKQTKFRSQLKIPLYVPATFKRVIIKLLAKIRTLPKKNAGNLVLTVNYCCEKYSIQVLYQVFSLISLNTSTNLCLKNVLNPPQKTLASKSNLMPLNWQVMNFLLKIIYPHWKSWRKS